MLLLRTRVFALFPATGPTAFDLQLGEMNDPCLAA